MLCDRAFFDRESYVVARELLGLHLVRTYHGRDMTGAVVEVEAFLPEDNLPALAKTGPWFPQLPVFPDEPGRLYVHTLQHYTCVNITTGDGGSVLIREFYPLKGIAQMRHWRGANCPVGNLSNSPGKVCQALAIDRNLNGLDITAEDAPFRIENIEAVPAKNVMTGRRSALAQDDGPDLRFFVRKPAMTIS